VKYRIAPSRVIILLAFLVFLFGIPAAASTAAAATSTGWVRLGNLSPTTAPVDIYVDPSGSSTATVVLHDVGYGTVSNYQVIDVGSYTVKMLSAGSSTSSKPVFSANLTVQAGRSYTVAALSVASSGGHAMVLDDSLTTPTGKSLVRVVQASLDQKVVKFYCSCGGYITTNATPGSVSSYAPIPPGNWTMTATGTSAKASLPVTLTAATVHTEVVLDSSGGGIQVVNLLDSAGANQPPVGGVATGFGGTAPRGPASPLPWVAVIGAGALLSLAGGLRLRTERRRLTARV
jgi:Domain of unknown function (DUF4397)